jgi:hypothetical protein
MFKSWKVAVKTEDDPKWSYNNLRFETKEQAKTYAGRLFLYWSAIIEAKIEGTEDEPNQIWVTGLIH